MKHITGVFSAPSGHWVGDGFPVRSLFSYGKFGNEISPFLLFDYAYGEFEPSDSPRGVESHPHRGFETVTIVYSGGLQHRDSAGHHGKIGPGDVQWMTAGSGVLHEEMHSEAFTQSGGKFEVVQLWVNLPASEKMTEPTYQDLLADQIPVVSLSTTGSQARIIAGKFEEVSGAAKTRSELNIWDLSLKAGDSASLPVPEGHIAILIVLRGLLGVQEEALKDAEFALFAETESGIDITAREDTTGLLLSGIPLNEPIAGYGPFVMSTQEEIRQAVSDFQSGRMGVLV